MEKIRLLFLVILVATGFFLAGIFIFHQPKARLDSSLAPFYQLFGHVTKGVNQAFTQVILVDSLDEKKYGETVKMQFDAYTEPENRDFIYANAVLKEISRHANKTFEYKVYVRDGDEPNACALPGGAILITSGLLTTLENEAELAAVLAHEMGHIELSHCLDHVRMQLALKKIGEESLGRLADFAVALLLSHSYNKNQEDDADSYAFEILKMGPYDPMAEGRAFELFMDYCHKAGDTQPNQAHVIRDYFRSHPPLALRAEKFVEEAKSWWIDHGLEKRYVGRKNLEQRERKDFEDEWLTR